MVDNLFEDETLVNDEYVASLAEKMDIPEEDVNPMDASLLAQTGNIVTPLFRPIGFTSWKQTVATVTGLVAKEQVVGTFGVLYNYDGELSEEGDEIWDRVNSDFDKNGHGTMAGFAFMVFNLLCAPCFAAIGAIKREMNNRKWTWAAIGWMTAWAYLLALITYNVFGLFGGVGFSIWTVLGIVALAAIIYGLVRKGYVPDESVKSLTSVDAAKAS